MINPRRLTGLLLVLVCCFGYHPVVAQGGAQPLPLVATVFNNATLLPGAGALGVFGIPVHPGLSLGTEFRYNQHPANVFFQTAKLAYHYHRYVQHSVQLYSEFGYRHYFKGRLDAGPRLGLGYLHSFPDMQRFRLDADGNYRQISNWGRPQLMASLAMEVGYTLIRRGEAPPLRLFMAYQFYLQMPFVQEYVPLLPNTALHLGVAFPFWKIKKDMP